MTQQTTCAVVATVNKQDGTPDVGATVTAKLSGWDSAAGAGYFGPITASGTCDANGQCTLNLWPNTLGAAATYYDILIQGSERTMRTTATVPNVGTVGLEAISAAPAGTPKADGQVSVDAAVAAGTAALGAASAAATSASAAATSATAAAGSATAAAGSATGAAGSATAAAGSATAAAGSAAGAAGSATTATTGATNAGASATAAAGSATSAATQAANAATSATSANAAATNAATSATAAGTSATGAGASATTAGNSAAAAATSATQAATSATAAAGSATAAAGSAAAAATSAATAANAASTAAADTAAAVNAAGAAQVAAATTQAQLSALSAAAASGSASSALAIYGNAAGLNAAQQIMLGYANTAQGQASLAAAYAASASSVVQQDLSGVTAQALHRSPNAIAALFVYDASKDSDGGAWVDRMQHTSWYNEALNGAWLYGPSSGFGSEMDARDWFGSQGAASLLTGDDSAFTSSVGNWTAAGANGTATAVNGRLRLTQTAAVGNGCGADIPITTVIGQRYRVDLTFSPSSLTAGKNTFINAGTTPAGIQIGQTTMVGASPGSKTLSFVATATTTHIAIAGSSTWNPGDYSEVSGITVKPVSFATNPSGAFYQGSADGKFYRLWKNLIANSVMLDGVSGAWGSGAAAPSGWTAAGATGSVTFSASARYSGSNQVRYQTTAQRAQLSQVVNVAINTSYTASCYVEAVTSGAPQIADVLNAVTAPAGATTAFRKNGGAATFSTLIASGDFLEVEVTTAGTAGSFVARHGLGSQAAITADVTLSPMQVEVSPAATAYEAKTTATDLDQTEIFRGSTAKFPRLSAIVAEAANVTIYDLTQPGRPMWLRLQQASPAAVAPFTSLWRNGTRNASSLAALNGGICIGINTTASDGAGGVMLLDFAGDRLARWCSVATAAPTIAGVLNGGVALRNSSTLALGSALPLIGSGCVNALAMTVRPTAPADPVTGLPVPTIGVAHGTGNVGSVGTVLMDDGSAVTYGQASNDGVSVAFTKRGDVCWGLSNASTFYALPLATANVASLASATTRAYFAGSPASSGGSGKKYPAVFNSGTVALQCQNGANTAENNRIVLMRENPSAATPNAAALHADLSGTYSTGWMAGDVRRAVIADTFTGTLSNAELVTNGTFTTDTTGWTANGGSAIAATGGELVVTNQANGVSEQANQDVFALVAPGKTYELNFTGRLGTAASFAAYVETQSTSLVTSGNKTNTTNSSFRVVFTVPGSGATACLVKLRTNGLGTAIFDNVSVKECVADRSYKAATASVNGTLARTAVAAAAQIVAYSGFSNDAAQTTELVTNGTFNTDVSGWTDQSTPAGTFTWSATSGGCALLTRSDAGNARADQQIATTIGRKYTINVSGVTVGGGLQVGVGTGAALLDVLAATNVNVGANSYTFTATTATSHINFRTTQVGTSSFDSVSVKPADAIGSAANVLQEAYSADLDFGTAAWMAEGWFNVAAGQYGPMNAIRNSAATGAVAGTPGTMPTDWGTFISNGLTRQVVGSGTDSGTGLPYVDVRVSGATTNANGFQVQWEGVNAVAAANAQAWASSAYIAVVAGSLTNISGCGINTDQYNGATWLSTLGQTIAPTASLTRFVATPTTNNASTTFIAPYLGVNCASGVAVDVTFRVAAPQLERGAAARAFIATSGTAFNGIAPIIDRSAATGAYWRMGLDGNGFLAAEAYDGTTTRRVTSTAAVNTGTYYHARTTYDGAGALTLLLNGVQNAQTTGAALLTLNNASALATYGQNQALTAAFPGSLALVRAGATVPSVNAAKFMYAQEAEMFRAGAQVTLPDTGNVLDLTYDDMEDKLKAITAANEASFVGLVRVSSAPVSAGSFAKTSMRSGVKLLARSTTNPGVDVTIPAYGLREELFNRAERAASLARLTTPFDFDAVTSQTDFALAAGWTAVEVSAAGALKREGATKDFTRLYDGFVESIRFGAAPGNAAWVQVVGRRA